MVTPMTPDGAVDTKGVAAVVEHLVATGHDGVVVNGTTGESPTLSSAESIAMVSAVKEAAGDRLAVTAGVGSNNTAHAVEMAGQATAAGADGLLVVSPYYNKPTQPGLLAHTRAIADAAELPVMLYDIPGRTATPFAVETLVALADHERIVAVKDAKGDLWAASQVMAATDLLWYSGADEHNLAHLAQVRAGFAAGFVERLERGAALDEHPGTRSTGDPCQHRGRGCDRERAGAGGDEHGHGEVERVGERLREREPGDQEGDGDPEDHGGHVPTLEPVDELLCGGGGLVGGADELDDLAERRVRGGRGDLDLEHAGPVHGAGEHTVGGGQGVDGAHRPLRVGHRLLLHRNRLPGDRGLIHCGHPGDHEPV